MEENNRINRRSRPRPYDLRRKVLLKNFLREQMTYIPEVQTESVSQNDDTNNAEESAISLHVSEDHVELSDASTSSSSTTTVNEQCTSRSSDYIDSSAITTESKHIVGNTNESVPDINSSSEATRKTSMLKFTNLIKLNRDSKKKVKDIVDNTQESVTDVNSSSNSTHESSMLKFSGLMKFNRDSKKKVKGILKAKDVCKSPKSSIKSKSFKTGLGKVFNEHKKPIENSSQQTQRTRNSPRSLFSMFKYRRGQRNAREVGRIKKSPYVDHKAFSVSTKHNTINQSVQTDDNWAREELLKVQQSNRLLREENRLLSESLSYFMSSASMDSQMNHCTSPLQSCNKNAFSAGYHDYFGPYNASSNWNHRSRISRSKSVQEHGERKNILRNNYRTRSMSCHNNRNKFLLPDPKPQMSSYDTHSEVNNIPRIRRKNILATLPVNSSGRSVQRRSSMPERILTENDRSVVCRRSGSFRDTRNRKPFYSLPSEAFY